MVMTSVMIDFEPSFEASTSAGATSSRAERHPSTQTLCFGMEDQGQTLGVFCPQRHTVLGATMLPDISWCGNPSDSTIFQVGICHELATSNVGF